jgi:hypothetical protein
MTAQPQVMKDRFWRLADIDSESDPVCGTDVHSRAASGVISDDHPLGYRCALTALVQRVP